MDLYRLLRSPRIELLRQKQVQIVDRKREFSIKVSRVVIQRVGLDSSSGIPEASAEGKVFAFVAQSSQKANNSVCPSAGRANVA